MGVVQPRHHSWRVGDGGNRKRPACASFLWYGGSCSSNVVLTVSLQHILLNFDLRNEVSEAVLNSDKGII